MITWNAVNYAKVLYSLGIKEEIVKNAENIFEQNNQLIEVFDNPVIKRKEKEAVIHAVFDQEIRNFISILCENHCIGMIHEIFEAYDNLLLDHKNMIKAKLCYAARPSEDELEQIKNMVCNKYNKAGVCMELQEDKSLIGGFVLTVGDLEFDKSIKGTLYEMQKTLARR